MHATALWVPIPPPAYPAPPSLGSTSPELPLRASRYGETSRAGQAHQAYPAYLTLSGNANTYNALPVPGIFTSGMIVRGTTRGLPPPVAPVVTATY